MITLIGWGISFFVPFMIKFLQFAIELIRLIIAVNFLVTSFFKVYALTIEAGEFGFRVALKS